MISRATPTANGSFLALQTNMSSSSDRGCPRTRLNVQCIDVMNFHHVRRFWRVRKTYELGADLPQATGRGAVVRQLAGLLRSAAGEVLAGQTLHLRRGGEVDQRSGALRGRHQERSNQRAQDGEE